jgi:hypothetical protein
MSSVLNEKPPSAQELPWGGERPLTVSVKRARELLDISHTTAWKLIGEKRLDTIQLGTKRLVIFSSIERLIDDLRRNASSKGAA